MLRYRVALVKIVGVFLPMAPELQRAKLRTFVIYKLDSHSTNNGNWWIVSSSQQKCSDLYKHLFSFHFKWLWKGVFYLPWSSSYHRFLHNGTSNLQPISFERRYNLFRLAKGDRLLECDLWSWSLKLQVTWCLDNLAKNNLAIPKMNFTFLLTKTKNKQRKFAQLWAPLAQIFTRMSSTSLINYWGVRT